MLNSAGFYDGLQAFLLDGGRYAAVASLGVPSMTMTSGAKAVR